MCVCVCNHENNVPSQPPSCHHNNFVAAHALGGMMYLMCAVGT